MRTDAEIRERLGNDKMKSFGFEYRMGFLGGLSWVLSEPEPSVPGPIERIPDKEIGSITLLHSRVNELIEHVIELEKQVNVMRSGK